MRAGRASKVWGNLRRVALLSLFHRGGLAPITPVWTGVISNSSIWHLRGVFNGQSRVHIQSPLQWVQPEGLSWEACCVPVSLSPPLLPTCFLRNHVDCSHSFSCLLTSGMSELGPQKAWAGGQGRAECRSALLPCYEVTLGWQKVTASFKVTLSL